MTKTTEQLEELLRKIADPSNPYAPTHRVLLENEAESLAIRVIAAERLVEAAIRLKNSANGNFEADDGERAFLVHSDNMFELDAALTAYREASK